MDLQGLFPRTGLTKWSLLSLAAGAVLYSLALSGLSLYLVPFICLLPLFLAMEEKKKSREIFLRGSVYGFLITAGVSYWVFIALYFNYNVSLPLSVVFFLGLVCLPVGLLTGLFALCAGYFRRGGLAYYALVLPALWTVFEYLRELLPLTLPWGFLGYAWADMLPLAQAADLIGVYGMSFITVLVNGCIFLLMKKCGIVFTDVRKWKNIVRPPLKDIFQTAGTAVLLLAGLLIYGLVSMGEWESAAGRQGRTAVIVQASEGLSERWDSGTFQSRVETYIGLSGRGEKGGDRLLVWPETVLNSGRRMDKRFFAYLMVSMGEESELITGGVREEGGLAFNTAYAISGTGTVRWYDKNILLPFAETDPLSLDLMGSYYEAPNEFRRGDTPPVLATRFGKAGLSICFEATYPWYVRRSVLLGAGLLVNISNDSWFGFSSMPWQHLAVARIRAIENRRYVLRASNSGYSAVISPSGELIGKSELFAKQTVRSPFAMMSGTSLYTDWGDWVIYLSLAVLLGWMVMMQVVHHREEE